MSDIDTESLKSITLDDINFIEAHNIIFNNPENKKEVKDKKVRKTEKTSIYEWVQLNENWGKKLLSDKFLLYDTIDDENKNIESVLVNSKFVKPKGIKQKFKKYLNDLSFQEFSQIINSYKNKNNKEFFGDFDIYKVKTRNTLIKELTKANLQTDNTTLHILSHIFDLDFIIFDEDTKKIIIPENKLHKNIILIYKLRDERNNKFENKTESEVESEVESELESEESKKTKIRKYHVKLIGIKSNDMNDIKTKFIRNKLPKELLNILDRHTFLLSHAQNAIEIIKLNNGKLSIKDIMKEINKNIQLKLPESDIDNLMIILKNLINQENFKKSIK